VPVSHRGRTVVSAAGPVRAPGASQTGASRRRAARRSTPLDDLLAARHRRSPVRLLVREPGAELTASPFEPPPSSDVPFGFWASSRHVCDPFHRRSL